MLRAILRIGAVLAGCLVIFGFADAWHPAAQSFALLRPVFAGVCLLGLWLGRGWLERGLAVIAIWLSVVTVVPSLGGAAEGGELRLYSKNLWFGNAAIEEIVEDIRAADVDVVMLQEISVYNEPILGMLEEGFPHQAFCRFSGVTGMAVVSRHPMLEGAVCSEYRALAGARIDFEGRAVWAVSAHIPWPWPYETEETVQLAEEMLRGFEGPVVVAGDFNAMPWTGRVLRLADASDAVLAGPNRTTVRFRGLPLVIDLAMGPGGGLIERRDLLGSDHYGLVADIRLDR